MLPDGLCLIPSADAAERHLRIPELEAAGVRHGFSCRPSPHPPAGGTDVKRLAAALGVDGLPRARLRQAHGAVVRAAADAIDGVPPVGDALVTEDPGVVLTLLTADCLPLIVVDQERRAVAAVHAGWRGTLAGILEATLAALGARCGIPPSGLLIAAGPAIRACCYEVGPEVEAAFATRYEGSEAWLQRGRGERRNLDLVAANRAQAERAGVPPAQFLDAGPCTRCRNDLFYSYRAEGPGVGRIVTLAALLPR